MEPDVRMPDASVMSRRRRGGAPRSEAGPAAWRACSGRSRRAPARATASARARRHAGAPGRGGAASVSNSRSKRRRFASGWRPARRQRRLRAERRHAETSPAGADTAVAPSSASASAPQRLRRASCSERHSSRARHATGYLHGVVLREHGVLMGASTAARRRARRRPLGAGQVMAARRRSMPYFSSGWARAMSSRSASAPRAHELRRVEVVRQRDGGWLDLRRPPRASWSRR